MNKIRYDRRV